MRHTQHIMILFCALERFFSFSVFSLSLFLLRALFLLCVFGCFEFGLSSYSCHYLFTNSSLSHRIKFFSAYTHTWHKVMADCMWPRISVQWYVEMHYGWYYDSGETRAGITTVRVFIAFIRWGFRFGFGFHYKIYWNILHGYALCAHSTFYVFVAFSV